MSVLPFVSHPLANVFNLFQTMCTEEGHGKKWTIIIGITITIINFIIDIMYGVQHLVLKCGSHEYIGNSYRSAVIALIIVAIIDVWFIALY